MVRKQSWRTPDGRFTKERPPPPPAEYRNPNCPLCGMELGHDGDEFVCEVCKAGWDPDNLEDGHWFDYDAPACLAQIEWFNRPTLSPEHENIRHLVEPCILSADGHEKHQGRDNWNTWTDDDPRVIRKGNR